MDLIKKIDKLTAELIKKTIHPHTDGEVNTCKIIYQLADKENWTETEIKQLDFLSKKIDISKKLFLNYKKDGKKQSNEILKDKAWLELLLCILIKSVLVEKQTTVKLKRFNVLFKALDIHTPSWKDILVCIEDEWQKLIQTMPIESPKATKVTHQNESSDKVTKIPLTVLFYEGPIARAYLATLKNLGLKPQKIIELIAENDLVSKKPVGKWMPKSLRKNYAANVQRSKIHYWSKHIARTNTALVNKVLSAVEIAYSISLETSKDANKLLPLNNYCDNIDSIFIKNLNDSTLMDYLTNEAKSALLYTGGGIVPAKLLSIQHLKFIHIHPGFLPDIRGADCTLWSSLITGHTSASCFYMSPGIDEGDIIFPCYLPQLSLKTDIEKLDLQLLYRLVYGYIDPWVRAYVLKQVLINHQEFENLDSITQNPKDGLTYHFMHQKVKQWTVHQMFQS